MTVATDNNRDQYTGDGSQTGFTVTFLFFANVDLEVTVKDAITGVESVKVLDTDYTVTGAGTPAGGTVSFTTAPASGDTITLLRIMPLTQETDYQPNDPFPAETHEKALDIGAMGLQQLAEAMGRALKLAKSSTFKDLDFPDPEASKPIAWNAAADALVNLDEIDNFGAIGGNLIVDNFVDVTDYTSGTTTALTLSSAPATKNNLYVQFDGVTQHHDTYSLAGTTLTFDTAIPLGTANVEVQYGVSLATNVPADGAVTTAKLTDNAVTLAKLAHGTANKFIGFDGSGVPAELAGGGASLPVVDTTSIVEDPADTTKEMRIDVGAVATGTVRVLTMPNQDIDLTPGTGAFQAFDADIDTLAQPAFSVHKSGNQTITEDVATKVTWETELFDTNNDFASNRFTPTVAGKYSLVASIQYNASDDGDQVKAIVYKNGSEVHHVGIRGPAAGGHSVPIAVVVDANGSTDYFEIFTLHSATTSKDVDGLASRTWFMGMRIGS